MADVLCLNSSGHGRSGSHSAVIYPENDARAWGLTGSFDALITGMLPLTFWLKTRRAEKRRETRWLRMTAYDSLWFD